MATAAVQIPSHNRVEPGSSRLIAASYPDALNPVEKDVKKIAEDWVDSLNTVLADPGFDGIEKLFLDGAYWRDQLGLSWNYRTLIGPQKILSFLKESRTGSRIKSISMDQSKQLYKPHISSIDYLGKVSGVAAFLTVDTDVGRGRGIVRLLKDRDGEWKAFTLFTAMQELKGYEETIKANRPQGVDHGGKPGRKNWQEMRTAMENFDGDLEPTVLILGKMAALTSRHSRLLFMIGAGQGGLTSAARLQQLQVPTLIVDRNPRIGDNWRNRYALFSALSATYP